MKKITEELYRIVDEINKTASFWQKKLKLDSDVRKLLPPDHKIFFSGVGNLKQEEATFTIPIPGWPSGHTYHIIILKHSEETSGDMKELGEYEILLNKEHEGTKVFKKDVIKFLQSVKEGKGVETLMALIKEDLKK